MRYQNVCIESFGYTLPKEVVTSDELESRLAPLYERLRLPAGRLELMTGIRERRFWDRGVTPGDVSIETGEKAIESASISREEIGLLVHASVCRDHLEPATACRVHHRLGLGDSCLVYDVSNACLGLLNGMVQAANMIELGQIRAALIVGTESGRALVETTIDELNANESLSRRDIKLAVASLTIGSASCGVLLTHRGLSQSGNRLTTAVARANTQHHALCHSDSDEASSGCHPLMSTDSEQLLHAGIGIGKSTFIDFLGETGWGADELHKTFCHQVGSTHRKLMLESMGLNPENDFATLQWLGNTGSVALPITMAIGVEQGFVGKGDQIGMLGIGSGLNSIMLAAEWNQARVAQSTSRASAESQTAAAPTS
jgi:3-oxoacyl-[acyl-carrier-protein] synthase-3